MAVPKLKLKINLTDLFGDKFKGDRSTKEAIGQEIIDRIAKRTAELRVDKKGNSLGTYSKSYRDSLDFKVSKGAQRSVNLTLDGDMLGNMDIIEQTKETITIGFPDSTQNAKAFGHISGFAGHPVLDGKVKKRDFFGLPEKELQSIASKFQDRVDAVNEINSASSREQLDAATLRAIDQVRSEIEGEDG